MLKERFGDPQQIICSHMEGLMKIPNCTSDRSSSLRSVYDKIMVNIRGLETLGVTSDQYGSLLIPVIMTKLPDEIRLRIAREAGRNAWKINPLLDILKREVEAREVSVGSTIRPLWSSHHDVTLLPVVHWLPIIKRCIVFIVMVNTSRLLVLQSPV